LRSVILQSYMFLLTYWKLPQYTQFKAILCTTSTKQLHNAYYKNYSQLTIYVQAANLSDCRIESNRIEFFWPELECSTVDCFRPCSETHLLELQCCGCHGDVTSSPSDAPISGRQLGVGVSLPKRAETFTAFDSKQKISGKKGKSGYRPTNRTCA